MTSINRKAEVRHSRHAAAFCLLISPYLDLGETLLSCQLLVVTQVADMKIILGMLFGLKPPIKLAKDVPDSATVKEACRSGTAFFVCLVCRLERHPLGFF